MNQRTLEYRKKVADSFVKCLEEKELHWKKNWQGMNMQPESGISGKPYKGCNRLYLSLVCVEKGYTDPRFATFRQIVDKGWKLRKGSKGYQVEYWMPYDFKEKKAISWDDYSKMQGEPEQEVGLASRYYTVFNAADIEGIPERKLSEKRDITVDELIPKISRNMGVEILNDGGDRAFYRPAEDKIHMPKPEHFQDDYSYNSVALHELSHATGAEKRLNRSLRNYFGTESYAYEELVAEISSAFMSQDLSIAVDDFQMENHKAYVQSWIKGIREKPDSLIMAIREAEKAANYLEYHAELINETEYLKTLGETKEVPVSPIMDVPAKMTLQEYLDLKGVGSPVGPYQDDKLIGHMKVVKQESTKKDWERTSEEYWKKREQARQEYKEKVENGELRDKTTIERALDSAQGHEDLASTQAARRLLAKQGIDWKTGEKMIMEKSIDKEKMLEKLNSNMPHIGLIEELHHSHSIQDKNVEKKQTNQRPKPEYKGYGNFVKVAPEIAKEAGTKEPKHTFGNSKEEILESFQKFNQERMQENDSIRIFDTCSIGQLNPETGKYENYIRYDVATGEEIPNIYLKLPYTKDKELFEQMRSELKRNGARFDPEKKQWYVGADADLSKFEKYLPKEEPAQKADEQQPNDTAAHQEAARTYEEQAKKIVDELAEKHFEKYLERKETKKEPAKETEKQQPADTAAHQEAAKTYLELPRMDKEEFKQTVAVLKENGARFDAEKKRWYVGADIDLDKFEKYLSKEEQMKKAIMELVKNYDFESVNNFYECLQDNKEGVLEYLKWRAAGGKGAIDEDLGEQYIKACNRLIEEIEKEPVQEADKQQSIDTAAHQEAARTYLELPRMEKEEFKQTVAELKENGAKFDAEKKQWYVNEGADLNKFEKYLPGEEQEQQSRAEESESRIITKEEMEEIGKEIESTTQYWPEDIPHYSVTDMKYEVTLDDGAKKIDISVKDIQDFGEMNAGEQIDALDEKIREHLAEEKAKESDSKEIVEAPDLQGMEKAALQNQEKQAVNYEVGEQVKFYVPEYVKTNGLVNKSGIQEVGGTIIDKQPILLENSTDNVLFTIRQEDGHELHINSDEIYTDSQVEVLKRAMEDKLPPEKFEIVSSMRFSAAQMEEIRFGFKDGLNEDQVTNYAKPHMEAGDMDLYRYGQIHGLKPEQIEKIIQTEQPEKAAWADKRRNMDKEIHSHRCQMAKSINQQGFKANSQLVKKIETLNHLTKKENSLKDISEAYKNQTLKERPECQELVDKIGNELKLQELAKNVPCQ